MHSYIIIKPDDFELTVQANMAWQLFYDVAHFLLHRTVNPENAICPEYSEEAVRQIRERAVSKLSFRSEVLKPEVMAVSLLSYAEEHLRGGRSNVAEELFSCRSVQSIKPSLEKIKVYAREWLNYYGIASMKSNIDDINGWLYHTRWFPLT